MGVSRWTREAGLGEGGGGGREKKKKKAYSK